MSQSSAKVYLHVVFSTKNRAPFLTDKSLRRETHAYLAGACRKVGVPSLIVGGVEDHVHISNTTRDMCGIEMRLDVVFVEPFQGSRPVRIPTQGCASLTLGCWMQPLRGKDRRSPETRRRAAEQGGYTRTRVRSESSATDPWTLLTRAAYSYRNGAGDPQAVVRRGAEEGTIARVNRR